MIRPVLQDEELLADVRATEVNDGHFRLWWFGQSGFLVQWRGSYLLLDPYLSDSLTRKYAETDKPHIRMTARVVDPSALVFIDVVTSSHNHTDHLDGETLRPLLGANPRLKIVIPEANRQFVSERLGIDPLLPVGLRDGGSVVIGEYKLTAVPAAHDDLTPEYLGYVMQFGPWTIYHSGDTLLYGGMAARLRKFAIDVALLPINGRAPERRVAGNLNAREAAELGKAIGARVVIPCHYGMFTFNTADPREFVEAADAIGQPHHVLRCGERWESRSLGERELSPSRLVVPEGGQT
ncbi:MAG: MBL fold metallo-hydrolase [Acidobacteria bacterium]|nr:MAG: MBL fold metallo-hydrolase [Acidobacteriota bacterium]